MTKLSTIFLLSLSLCAPVLARDCARKAALLALGVPIIVERSAHDLVTIPIDFLRKVFGFRNPRIFEQADGRKYALTGRGPLEALDLANLYFSDLSGLKILDVASGNGRFAQAVNLIYGKTGTHVTTLDLNQSAPRPDWWTTHVKADAFRMPFSNGEFDLLTNNWMLAYFFDDEAKVKNLVQEHIRVTKAGGQIRFGFGMTSLTQGRAEKLARILYEDPRVKEVEFIRRLPLDGTVIVHLMQPGDLPTLRPEKIRWKIRFAILPSALISACLTVEIRALLPEEDLWKTLANQMAKTEEIIRHKLPKFRQVSLTTTKLNEQQIIDILVTLSDLQNFYETTPVELLNSDILVLYVAHGQADKIFSMGDMVRVDRTAWNKSLSFLLK